MKFSVIIPALDEAEGLPATLAAVRAAAGERAIELVVVDGGSRDGTSQVAEAGGAVVWPGTGGRGGQLAEGVRRTTGDVVLFLHADTWLGSDALDALERVLADPRVVGGGFHKSFRDGPAALRCGGRTRSAGFFHLTGLVMGDQTLFVRRSALDRVGGVPEQPLMEDVELSRRLADVGRLELVDSTVSTSGRRFLRWGVPGTWAWMGLLLAGWWLGISPRRLDRWYRWS